MNILDIENAVNEIQVDVFGTSGEVEYFHLSVTTNGFCITVDFCGIRLWSSEDDNRPYGDESDENTLMPIERHLRCRLREELKKLDSIVV